MTSGTRLSLFLVPALGIVAAVLLLARSGPKPAPAAPDEVAGAADVAPAATESTPAAVPDEPPAPAAPPQPAPSS
ncbi:MAG: 2-oxoglutarate dehydrogenase, E2 component, dihydrolipoamide succinyltransferase, partial [Polyangiaceae bacterium]